jgi:ubiquitin C-terminal hydrolase
VEGQTNSRAIVGMPPKVSASQQSTKHPAQPPTNVWAGKGESVSHRPPRPKDPFAPVFRDLLQRFKLNVGEQEDAHEFFSFCINGLDTEMLALLPDAKAKPANEDGGGWEEIGAKNRKRKIQAGREAEHSRKSPVTSVFGGRLRIVLSKHERGLQDSVSFQSFSTLHLDIARHDTLAGALEGHMARETIEGYRSDVSRQAVRASQQTTLDQLPLVMVLHLKRFDLMGEKIAKYVGFPSLLPLSRGYLFGESMFVHGSSEPALTGQEGWSAAWETFPKSQRYRLRAVVMHHGRHLSQGHYTACIRVGPSDASTPTSEERWLHCDDRKVSSVPTEFVYRQQAYMLFYENLAASAR